MLLKPSFNPSYYDKPYLSYKQCTFTILIPRPRSHLTACLYFFILLTQISKLNTCIHVNKNFQKIKNQLNVTKNNTNFKSSQF